MTRDTLRQTINVLAVIVTLVVNGLANALPLNGQTTAAISDRFQVLFTPAGYVFSIWGLIYIGLIAFAIYQALPGQRENVRLRRIGYLFALSCAANIVWLFLWHYEVFLLTVPVMLALLLLLIAIYLRLDVRRTAVTTIEKWTVNIPFSVYLGWISIATIANVADVLDYLNWNGWGLAPEVWTIIMLIVGVALATVMSVRRGDIAYALVVVWAFAGIGVKQVDTPTVATAAWIAAAAVIVVLIASTTTRTRRMPIS